MTKLTFQNRQAYAALTTKDYENHIFAVVKTLKHIQIMIEFDFRHFVFFFFKLQNLIVRNDFFAYANSVNSQGNSELISDPTA